MSVHVPSSPSPPKGLTDINKKGQRAKVSLPLNFPPAAEAWRQRGWLMPDGAAGSQCSSSPGLCMNSGPLTQRPGFVWAGASARVLLAGPGAPVPCRVWNVGASGATMPGTLPGRRRMLYDSPKPFCLTSSKSHNSAKRYTSFISSSFDRR